VSKPLTAVFVARGKGRPFRHERCLCSEMPSLCAQEMDGRRQVVETEAGWRVPLRKSEVMALLGRDLAEGEIKRLKP